MRRRQIFFLIAGLALAACADPTASRSTAATDPSSATRIETDQSNGAIRFIVDGREEARIDAGGIYTRGGLNGTTVTLSSGNLPGEAEGTPAK